MIDDTNRNTALASALAEELARCGVERAVVCPGSRSSPVTLALDGEAGIATTVVLDERAAGFVALGAALSSGRPVAVSCTSGSAAANLMPAVVEAAEAGVPLILLTSDRPPELRGIGAGQTIDQVKLYGRAAQWFCEVGTHEANDVGLLHYRSVACRAVGEAVDGHGPVHLNLAWRDPLGPEPRPDDLRATDPLATEGRSGERPLTVPLSAREPTEPLLAAAAETLAGAERPVIVAGRLPDPAAAAAVAELAAATALPVLAEPTSQLRYGRHDRTGVIAAYDLIARERPAALAPDLVLRFGDLPTSKALRGWLGAAGGPDQIVVDPPGGWDDATRKAGVLVRASTESIARGLARLIHRSDDGEWTARWQAAEEAAQAAIEAVLAETDGSNEPALVRAALGLPADGEQVLLASSMPVRDAETFAGGGDREVRVFANRGANGIDGLVATSVGLALGNGLPTWALLGDLALAHDLGGLATIASAPGPLRLIVIDNGGGRIFEFLPQAGQVERERFERLFITPSPLDLERVAALFELDYVEIETAADLDAAPERSRALLHARVDPEQNVGLHRRIAEAVAASLPL